MLRTLASLLWLFSAPLLAQTTQLPPAADQQLAHDVFKQLIEIKSGYSTGSTTPVAEAVAARLRAAGFPDSDIFIGGPAPNKYNLVARFHGSGAHRPLLLLAHEDVVEAKAEDWSPGLDPFTFNERDGYFYGRGTADDKAQAAIWVETLIRMKREGFTPDRDIILALTADEEGGGPYSGIQWLLKNRRNLIDSELALNEGGYGEISHGRKISNDLQAAEKYMVTFHLEVHNKGGHSSLPVPDNAIYHLAGALTRIADFGFPLKTNEATNAYFHQMARIETGPSGQALEGFDGTKTSLQRAAAASPTWNSMLRTTCVATQIQGGHAINALPQLAAATINCRVLPEDSVEYVQQTLTRIIDDPQVAISIQGEVHKGPASPLSPTIIKAVTEATKQEWSNIPVVPLMVPYATDGVYLRAAGIPTYGVQGLFMDRDDIRFHGRDERLLVSSFYEDQQFLYTLVKLLATN
ncbi:MAG TPA: M20/M25/M40 family metallo-hydrolase [Acidobacteriaceae bacterium]|nr:M20/M25/M40 family metallo-hydrolase [Acidobacteriaceae bacterium]